MLHKTIRSFVHAWRGLVYTFKTERNFRIEIFIGALIVASIIFLDVQRWEISVLAMLVFWVIFAELINTAVERVSDILKPRVHPYAKVIKDIMAASVLISGVAAVTIGSSILVPYIIDFFRHGA